MTPQEARALALKLRLPKFMRDTEDVIEALARFGSRAEDSEREACGEMANRKAAEVLAKNTYRGRPDAAASFAAGMLEDLGLSIRQRGAK